MWIILSICVRYCFHQKYDEWAEWTTLCRPIYLFVANGWNFWVMQDFFEWSHSFEILRMQNPEGFAKEEDLSNQDNSHFRQTPLFWTGARAISFSSIMAATQEFLNKDLNKFGNFGRAPSWFESLRNSLALPYQNLLWVYCATLRFDFGGYK